MLSKAIDNINSTHRKNRDEYCFVFFNSNGVHYQSGEDSKATLRLIKNQGTNINISVCSDISQTALDVYEQEYDKSEYTAPYAILLYKNTSGKYLKDDMDPNNFTTKVIEHIYNRYVYRAIIATGYKFVELNSDLQSNYNMYIQSCNEHADIPSISLFDTDEDGLNDYDEIMFKNNNTWLVDNSNEDDVILFSYEYIVNSVCDNLFYVQKGLERYCARTLEDAENPQSIQTLYSCKILPINSNPTSVDSDGDGYLDSVLNDDIILSSYNDLGYIDITDPKPLYSNVTKYNLYKYVPVDGNNMGYATYGGNQMSFTYANDKNPQNNSINKFIRKQGCWLIAFSDIMIYISNYNSKYRSLTDIKINLFGDKNIPFDEYKEFVQNNYRFYSDNFLMDFLTVPTRFVNLYNKFFEYKKVDLYAQFFSLKSFIYSFEFKNLYYDMSFDIIKKNIQNGMPVHLCIDALTNFVVYEMPKCSYGSLYDYQNKPFQPLDSLICNDKFTNHSVVITGIIIDTVQGKDFIEFSSWGRKYILDFEDFLDNAINSMATGIIVFSNTE